MHIKLRPNIKLYFSEGCLGKGKLKIYGMFFAKFFNIYGWIFCNFFP